MSHAVSPTSLAIGGALLVAASPAAAGRLVEHVMTVRGWSDGIGFTHPRGVAVDPARGQVVVANTSAHRVEAFSASGRPLWRLVHLVPGPDGTLVEGYPSGVAVDGTSRVFVTDNLAAYVDVLGPRGRSVARLELPGGGRAGAVAVAADGSILVAESGARGRVHVFGPDLEARAAWGEPGKGAGRLADIRALSTAPGGRVVVVCPTNERVVQIFTAAGEYLHGFGEVEIGAENFSLPSGVAVTDDGRIWISDEIRQRIQVYQPDGLFLGAVGGDDAGEGDFMFPSAIATDGRERIVVVERVAGRYRLLGIPSAREEARP